MRREHWCRFRRCQNKPYRDAKPRPIKPQLQSKQLFLTQKICLLFKKQITSYVGFEYGAWIHKPNQVTTQTVSEEETLESIRRNRTPRHTSNFWIQSLTNLSVWSDIRNPNHIPQIITRHYAKKRRHPKNLRRQILHYKERTPKATKGLQNSNKVNAPSTTGEDF